ncbi:hypothetical protein [Bordetella hinzii]|uniref:Uncharacterized protein n=1 Tax=Bordetella hinzii TaxID=103855 RepID=A0AAN1S0G7_9BORD|nr:hypothetical protein [Bordetella hinzii]AKQ59668.1 hypothetical protein ACR55_01797 [Bordetella hinzii]AZW19205.1 hypothetical protein CS347_21820 [Bordetella hinzii]MBZ0073574.1 hypothetical protein [Bordetella hinzii]MBZ0077950.1 hypothetical protein [Bordetella hinzii]MBZ0082371.1 hypothetical protein [Bordetella hinzii]
MSIYGEPKNGDFARYVEELSRRGAASSAPSPGEMPRRRARQDPDAARAVAGSPMPGTAPSAAGMPAAEAPTLAQQASLRQSSSRQAFLGFVAICLAVWNLAAYLAHEHQSPARFVIPALVGFWLFRGAARKRARSRGAARLLPPLNLPPKP